MLCVAALFSLFFFVASTQIKWDQPALALHNFIRGSDKLPGAWSKIDGQVGGR